MSDAFEALFGFPPAAEGVAPGRVNLLGEHTDYSEGYVLPTVVPQTTRVRVAENPEGINRYRSANLGEEARFAPGERLTSGFGRYVQGCVEMLRAEGAKIPPLAVLVDSSVPMGAGLSSSAALEVAVLRALRALLGLALDDVAVARLAQQAEIQHAGVRVGILDQMACSLGQAGHMLFLDTRTLERRLLPLPQDAELVVIHSGVPRRLEESAYNRRREECEEAAAKLGVPALRDARDGEALAALPPPLDRRARHVVSENARVLEVLGGVSAQRMGALMSASHDSLRDQFEVSTPELDLLVALIRQHRRGLGAKLTGAGFGGAVVGLVRQGAAGEVKGDVLGEYGARGFKGTVLV